MAVSARRRGGKRDIKADADQVAKIVVLPRSMDLTFARPLASTLLDHRGASLIIDASHVQHLGAQCLQVLLAARKTWEDDKKVFELRDSSSRLLEDLELLGVDQSTILIGKTEQ